MYSRWRLDFIFTRYYEILFPDTIHFTLGQSRKLLAPFKYSSEWERAVTKEPYWVRTRRMPPFRANYSEENTGWVPVYLLHRRHCRKPLFLSIGDWRRSVSGYGSTWLVIRAFL